MSEKPKFILITRQRVEGAIFFILFYLHLWLLVDLRLVPNTGGVVTRFPVFYKGWDFFSNTCSVPGGAIEYLSSFLVQFFYVSWTGAAAVTLQAWLIYFFTMKFLKSLNMSSFSIVSYAGPIIILTLYNRYIYFFNIATGFLSALIVAYVYALLAEKRKKVPSLLLFLYLFLFLYPISGASVLMFIILCMIYELITRSLSVVAGGELLLGFAGVFLVGVFIYNIELIKAFTGLLPVKANFSFYMESTEISLILYFFFPLIIILLWLIKKIPPPAFISSMRGKRYFVVLSVLCSCIFIILISLPVYLTYNKKDKDLYSSDFYSNQRDWEKALEAAEGIKENPLVVCVVNRALYHEGRLPQDMFLYPQNPDALFYTMFAPLDQFRGLYQGTDLCIDLGLINYAEHHVWQKIETFGPLPELIKRLATIKMVKGNMNAARVYLSTLSKTLFHADWANEYLAKLEKDPNLNSDQYIHLLRRKMPKNDYIIGEEGPQGALSNLLIENKYNKMAFEYELALHLLHKNTDGVVRNLHRLPDFYYKRTPKPYEEAFFLSLMKAYPRSIDVPEGFKVSEESKKRFQVFQKFMRKYGSDTYAVEREVTRNYRNTYYEYFFYGYKYNGGQQ